MNLMEEGMEIIKERKILFVEMFVPYFIASYGCHLFNMMNLKRKVYMTHGRVPDTRMQILFTAPPGWSKSLFLKHCVKPGYGILNAGTIPTRFMGSCTEAGWTGSSGNGAMSGPTIGIAERYKTGVVAMEEFTAITAMLEQQHSQHLEAALNMALFEGDVEKDLKGTTISFHTDITLWAGNQIMNFSISGGMFRRFFHLYWCPRLHEGRLLEDANWDGDNTALNKPRLDNYHLELIRLQKNLSKIQGVEFTPAFKRLLIGVPHFEKNIYKAFAIGYIIMLDSNVPTKLIVDASPEIAEYIQKAKEWRRQLLADPRGFQVEGLLYDLEANKYPVAWKDVREKNLLFSVSFNDTDEIVRNLMRAGRVKYDSSTKMLRLL